MKPLLLILMAAMVCGCAEREIAQTKPVAVTIPCGLAEITTNGVHYRQRSCGNAIYDPVVSVDCGMVNGVLVSKPCKVQKVRIKHRP